MIPGGGFSQTGTTLLVRGRAVSELGGYNDAAAARLSGARACVLARAHWIGLHGPIPRDITAIVLSPQITPFD